MNFIEIIEKELNITTIKNYRGMQPCDVYQTYADTQDLFDGIGYTLKTTVKEGVGKLVQWYKEFYKV
ncbi:hypothetical protein H4J45_17690 [Colwellia sp. BRX10-6]|uniref:hypothetical protein n=1 Tax=unclassified Colwellia TaxID=196834 RepID=UPI0015F4A773|nr:MULTISPECIES: hypothetical protein [unclassified Colwellia]MBA6384453.1 hypothetical protein [Colwellia sp. BRX10-9]MBA6395917.1 hypothetical protein [Colwellia sp. BRX10-6]